MLDIKNKISYFKEYLNVKNSNYGDEMKEEIYNNLFELGNDTDFVFLEKLNTKKEMQRF